MPTESHAGSDGMHVSSIRCAGVQDNIDIMSSQHEDKENKHRRVESCRIICATCRMFIFFGWVPVHHP